MEHQTPTPELFNEIKQAAIMVWQSKDDTHGYVTSKVNIVRNISNYKDNVMIAFRMFDTVNQGMMLSILTEQAKQYIRDNN